MSYQRRGTMSALMKPIRAMFRYGPAEMKWKRIDRRNVAAYLALVDMFFQEPWLQFHMLVVRRDWVDTTLHEDNLDLARRKHLTKFLANKIGRCIRVHRGQATQFRVYADNPYSGSGYTKAHEAAEAIGNNVLAQIFADLRPIDRIFACDSKQRPGIQLCDVLLGACMDAWNSKARSDEKDQVKQRIAQYLGWEDLHADTKPQERKFNIWYLLDPRLPRPVATRQVQLVHQLPPVKRYGLR